MKRRAMDLGRCRPGNLAERLDPEGIAMIADEVLLDLSRRSSSGCANNARANFSSRWPGAVPYSCVPVPSAGLAGRDAPAHAGIDLHALDPFLQRLRTYSSSARWTRWSPQRWVLQRCSCTGQLVQQAGEVTASSFMRLSTAGPCDILRRRLIFSAVTGLLANSIACRCDNHGS